MIFNKQSQIIRLLLLFLWIFISCELDVEDVGYEEKLVVFGNLIANKPIIDTFFVSRTYSIDEPFNDEGKWIADAVVTLSVGDESFQLSPVPGNPGRYLDLSLSNIIHPNSEYLLDIQWQDKHVTSTTRVPDTLTIISEGTDDWECENEPVWVPPINLYEEENTEEKILLALNTRNFNLLSMDTVIYREGECYTSSFASVPMFRIRWESATKPGLIRAATLALEDSIENVILDTSLSAHVFKGHMYINEDGDYFWPNPTVWNLSQQDLDFGWLSFNYYGVNMIIIQAADQGFRDYFEGNAFRQQFILPKSNIEDGYGLFSSSFMRVFFVYVKPEFITMED